MAMDTLTDLLTDALKDLYSAENQLVKALPQMAEKASSADLKEAFTSHLSETEGHIERLNEIAKTLQIKLGGKKCAAMEGLVKEGEEVIEEDGEEAVLDVGLIGAAQRVEHYEMAAYTATMAIAAELGHQEVVDLLQLTLDEENAADETLTQIAQGGLLEEAAQTEDADEEEEEVK